MRRTCRANAHLFGYLVHRLRPSLHPRRELRTIGIRIDAEKLIGGAHISAIDPFNSNLLDHPARGSRLPERIAAFFALGAFRAASQGEVSIERTSLQCNFRLQHQERATDHLLQLIAFGICDGVCVILVAGRDRIRPSTV